MNNIQKICVVILITATALISIPFTCSAETVTHSYDHLNRLIRSEYSDGMVLIFDYDKLGNRVLKKKLYKPHVLTIHKTGEGTGKVVSTPARINCGPTCSESFSEGVPVTLTAIPDSGSLFTGWSGCDDPCVLSLTTDSAVSAIFQTCGNQPVKAAGSYYLGIQAAYDAATDGSSLTIQVQSVTLVENFNANRNITLSLDGGYDCNFSAKTGVSALKGMVTTSSGSVTISDYILQN